MAEPTREPIVFMVPGRKSAAPVSRGAARADATTREGPFIVKHSVELATNRDGGLERVTAVPGEDFVVLEIAGGPELFLHPDSARELMRAQASSPSRGASAAASADGAVHVQMQLDWNALAEGKATRGQSRGLGGVLVKAFKVLTGIGKDQMADFAVSKVVAKMDGQVDEGVYLLDQTQMNPLKGTGRHLDSVGASPNGEPLLVMIHGTFSSTSGTFEKLWSHQPQLVKRLFSFYENRVYALDHRTLAVSPITNALTLAKALPMDAKLHLVTHSRGGLVAEVFARACASTPADVDAFPTGGAFEGQRADLAQLVKIVRERRIAVERMVRVACPARGTLLASKRLDAYLSVLRWALSLAQVPVVPELVEFIGAVASRKADPAELPGLEAQMPGSNLVNWLHAVDQPIPGDLRVIAGDMQGDSVITWLKTLVADSFYWTDNDLVVQTRSMYGGAPRAGSAKFVFDQGGAVSHFNYFKNDRTAQAVVEALVEKTPAAFNTIGPLSWAGEASDGTRAAVTTSTADADNRPLVFLLPGIVGSNLKVDDDRIWLGWQLVNGLQKLKYDDGRTDDVLPDGPIGSTYDKLRDFLARTHTVVEFAFDWRRPIEDEAHRLADAVEQGLAAREANGHPVRIVAHSMGGILARTMQLVRPETWDRMLTHEHARVLMLGTPNGGSWAPMQVLSGDDTFGNMLAMAGAPFQSATARQLMAEFPGLLQLQADIGAEGAPLAQSSTWKKIADDDIAWLERNNVWHRLPIQLMDSSWGIPPQPVLDRAVALRRRLDAQLETPDSVFRGKVLLVIGQARSTPDGISEAVTSSGADSERGMVYLNILNDGDGRVTRRSAMLPGVRTWMVRAAHGDLPKQREAYEGYLELLTTGRTRLLNEATTSATRGASDAQAPRERSRPSREVRAPQPPQKGADLFTAGDTPARADSTPRGAALSISVTNGDLTFIAEPLLLGHYRSLKLTGTERVMDRVIGGTMDQALKVGSYPDAPGTNRIFSNLKWHPYQKRPLPSAVIVVGLGAEGALRSDSLITTVRQGVLACSQRAAESPGTVPQSFEIAATLIGSGGVGFTAAESALCIVQGVKEANELLEQQADHIVRWPLVSKLRLIELYLDRATEAWQAIREQAHGAPALYDLEPHIVEGSGALRRPPEAGYRGADYDFITAITTVRNGETRVTYSMDSKRARTELRDESVQLGLIRNMANQISNADNRDTQIGRSLFKLLVPTQLKPFFGGSSGIVLELDAGTAGIPWELLDTAGSGPNALPWAIRAKVLRKLRMPNAPPTMQDANADADVLVVGDPRTDRAKYPLLDGARVEAMAVEALLSKHLAGGRGQVTSLIRDDHPEAAGPDALAVINALHQRDWRIVHIAGHGEPPQWVAKEATQAMRRRRRGDPRGVVLSNDTFLGSREIRNMSVVPELVFVNCCHLAARAPDETLAERRTDFAVGVAEALISIGVRCVVAAAWAVDDEAALTFAQTFYGSLLRGHRFIDAVASAREAARACGGNTWAAYQCYGDPEWTFSRDSGDAQRPRPNLGDEYAGIASAPALQRAINAIEIQASMRFDLQEQHATALKQLETRFWPRWGARGMIAEAFGMAWNELGDRPKALEFLNLAVRAEDGSASIKAAEQFCNVRARLAWEQVRIASGDVERAAGNGDAAAARKALQVAVRAAAASVEDALALLDSLSNYEPTMERESLRASAHKRLAMVHAVGKNRPKERKALEAMLEHYRRALKKGHSTNHDGVFYPGLNTMAAMLATAERLPCRLSPRDIALTRKALERKASANPDFWSEAGSIELRMYTAMARCALAGDAKKLLDLYADLYERSSGTRKWESIYDTAGFVLPRYQARVKTAEEKAAAALVLEKLESFVSRS